MATKAIVGEKVGMTQVWDDDNRVVPATVLQVKPCRVVQVKTDEHDGYSALQVTFGTKKASKITKPKPDEIETAHPDVLELFFQVFAKGKMEDGEGREIDSKKREDERKVGKEGV